MKKNVLIVEDDPELLKMECLLLSSRGYEVTGVTDGEKALAHLSKSRPDLVLLDVMMPGVDGFDVCKTIKEDELYSDIPVIMLTAKSSVWDMEQGKIVGADWYITKPFRTSMLLQTVDRFLH